MENIKRVLTSVLIGIFLYVQFGAIIVSGADSNQPKETFSAEENIGIIPLMWTVAIVGGSIAITLSYVSWRKYKAEQKRKAKKDKLID